MMRYLYKAITCIIFCLMLVFQTGCAGNDFTSVAPPLNTFPSPESEYPELVDVKLGDFIEKKTLRVDKESDTLFTPSNNQEISKFSVGEKGILSYDYKDKKYSVEAYVISNENNTGVIIQSSVALTAIPIGISGEFSIITNEEKDCILVDKSAVLLLDDSKAIVLMVKENNVLYEKEITVDRSNDAYYKIISGVDAGDKVVKRR